MQLGIDDKAVRVRYLELVTVDIDAVCNAYETMHEVEFGEAEDLLGGARTGLLKDGGINGVREFL